MTLPLALRHWSAATAGARDAVELLATDRHRGLEGTMARLGKVVGDASFLVVPIDALDQAAIERAAAAFFLAGGSARVCLAGTRAALEAVDDAAIACERIGLLLDDVTVDTPLSDLISDRIEAVRFDADFVNRAARNMRLGCALEAMLSLARDLGLCTLGADAVPGGGSLAGRASFDYLPSTIAPPASARLPVKRELAGAGGR